MDEIQRAVNKYVRQNPYLENSCTPLNMCVDNAKYPEYEHALQEIASFPNTIIETSRECHNHNPQPTPRPQEEEKKDKT